MTKSEKTAAALSARSVIVEKLVDWVNIFVAGTQALVTTVYEICRYGLDEAQDRAYKAHRQVRDKERYEKYGHTEDCALLMAFDDQGCSCGLNKGGPA